MNGLVVHPLYLAILVAYGAVIGALVGATQTAISHGAVFKSKSIVVTALVIGFVTAPALLVGEGGLAVLPAFLAPVVTTIAVPSALLTAAVPVGLVTLGALVGVSLSRESLTSGRRRG